MPLSDVLDKLETEESRDRSLADVLDRQGSQKPQNNLSLGERALISLVELDAAKRGVFDTVGDVQKDFVAGLAKGGTGIIQTGADIGAALGLPGAEVVRQSATNVARQLDEATTGTGADIVAQIGQVVGLPAKSIPAAIALGAIISGTGPLTAERTPEEALLERGKRAAKGGALTGTLAGLVRGISRGVQGIVDKLKQPQAVIDFKKIGAEPTLGVATGSATANKFEQAIKDLPLVGERIKSQLDDIGSKIGRRVETISKRFGDSQDVEGVGAALKQGVREFSNKFEVRKNALSSRVDDLVDPTDIINVSNTKDVALRLTRGLDEVKELANAVGGADVLTLKNALKKVPDDGITYQAFKSLMSLVGRQTQSPNVIATLDKGAMKQLYAAMSDDLAEFAMAKGGETKRAIDNFNRFYRSGIDKVNNMNRTIVESSRGPINNAEALRYALKDINKSGDRLRELKNRLPRENFNDVVSFITRDLGRPKAGKQTGELFSPETFLTNWDRLSAGAKNVAYGKRGAPLRESMERMVRNSIRLRTAGQAANSSKTAGGIAAMLILGYPAATAVSGGDLGSSTAEVAAGVASAAGMAYLLTNPSFVNWLTKGLDITKPADILNHAAKLSALSIRNKDDAEALDQFSTIYLDALKGAAEQ